MNLALMTLVFLLFIGLGVLVFFLLKAYRKNTCLQTQLLGKDLHLKELETTSQLKELSYNDLKEQMTLQFESIANKALEKNTQTSQKNMSTLLTPLKEEIKDFSGTINEHKKENFSLKNEIKNIVTANQQISEQAKQLTQALKGSSQIQGDWGEMILNKILSESGLRDGEDYHIQQTFYDDLEKKNKRPDVVVNLPDKKNIIIDSKVSIVSYERCCSDQEQPEASKHIKAFTQSIRNHIKDLESKKYQRVVPNSPDFVLMFIPIEGAYMLLMKHDPSILQIAWDRKISIVCPSTLFTSLKTISFIWKQEQQTKNAFEIAKKAGALYDKIAGFAEDMEKVGKQIDTASSTHQAAFKKLSTGKGNILGQTEKIKKLGAQTYKSIEKYIDES